MNIPLFEKLAEVLVGHSTELKKGEHVLIEASEAPDGILIALIDAARRRGAHPHVQVGNNRVSRALALEATEEQIRLDANLALAKIKRMDAFIALRGSDNVFEMSDVPPARQSMISRLMRKAQDARIDDTRWVVLRWPNPSMAQQARMSTSAFEDFFFEVCTLDYGRMAPGMKALNRWMTRTDRVNITGPGTDLSFSIKGMGAISSGGKHNIPDGEAFSCPIKDSVEGVISYNVPSLFRGFCFEQVRFVFRKGRIVEASANDQGRLDAILDADPGARYVGEFALGFNPSIREPMLDTLFDEKIAGSFHFTPGQAYKQCDNGNRSQVHWDLVNIQRPDYGGGEIRFDGKLIRKDGLFVPASLQKLNPDFLSGAA